MGKASSVVDDPSEVPARNSGARKPGPMADPLVKSMTYVAVAMALLLLASVIGVLWSGISSPTGPRSSAERQLAIASAQAKGATGDAAAPYVTALTATGNFSAARIALVQARSGDTTAAMPGLDLAEARLMSAKKDYAKAIAMADRAMKGYEQKRDAEIAAGAEESAKVVLGEDYYNAVLVKAYALVELNKWKDAVAAFDIYVDQNPTAADILVDRGNAKREMGDKAGAEADYREALKYTPDDAQAKAGMKMIGVAP